MKRVWRNSASRKALFVPGAIADSLTSFGGVIFGTNSQTNLLAFINAGAAGSYGTVAEPGNDTQKFPNPQVYFYQARGFSLAESYYQSVNVPYLGLMVAEPLAAPFAQPGYGAMGHQPASQRRVERHSNAFRAISLPRFGNRPLQQVDLFVDGAVFQHADQPGPVSRQSVDRHPERLSHHLYRPHQFNFEHGGIRTGCPDQRRDQRHPGEGLVHGDRIELQSIATNPMTVPFYVADSTPTNTPGLSYSVNYLPDSFPPQMTPGGLDKNGAFTMEVEIPSTLPYVILASTNLMNWQPIFTNSVPPGLLDFTDYDSTNYPVRFYRMTWPAPDQPPQLSAPGIAGSGVFQMHVDSTPGLPWAIQISSNLVNWTSVFTNQPGGAMDFVDASITNSASRFYRAWLVPPGPPGFTVLNMATNLTLVQVDSAVRPYTVGVSTNQGQWTALATNFALGEIQTAAASAIGSGNVSQLF